MKKTLIFISVCFITISTKAQSPETNYAKIQAFKVELEAYKNGVKNYLVMPSLIKFVDSALENKIMADNMAINYFQHYLNMLNDPNRILTKVNLEVALEHKKVVSSTDQLVVELSRNPNPHWTDSVYKLPGNATRDLLSYVAMNEELEGKLVKDGKPKTLNPNWKRFHEIISKKYPQVDATDLIDQYITSAVGIGQDGFYIRFGNWSALNKYYRVKVNRWLQEGGHGGDFNFTCWYIYFCRVTDNPSLAIANEWMDSCLKSVKMDKRVSVDDIVMWTDTKAALLYKQGLRKAAIATEGEAIAALETYNLANGKDKESGCQGYRDVIGQMERGEKIGGYGVVYPNDWTLKD